MAWVRVCQAAMSDDCPQGNLSSAAPAGPAHAARMAAKPNSRGNIFLSPALTVNGRHGGFNIVLRIEPTPELKTRDETQLFLYPIYHARPYRAPARFMQPRS